MTGNTKISVHDLAHSKGMPAAATEVMLLMQDRIKSQAAEIERLKREVMLQMVWKTEAQNEVERLLEALRDILRGDDPAIPGAIEHIARAALGETE